MISWSTWASKTRAASERLPRAGSGVAQLLLDFLEGAGLLDAAEAGEDGVEVVEEDQRQVLVVEELAIAGLVAIDGVIVQTFEQLQQSFELAEAAQVFFEDLGLLGRGHAGMMHQPWSRRKARLSLN